jgi:hypothetical protein
LATIGLPSGPNIEAFAVQNQAGFAAKNTLDKCGRIIKVSLIDMKNNPLTTVLLGVLTISALLSVGFCWRYVSNTRELRTLQTQANMINNNRTMINSLANDTVEYSKKNPAIDPILESVGLKPGKSAPAAATKPATK